MVERRRKKRERGREENKCADNKLVVKSTCKHANASSHARACSVCMRTRKTYAYDFEMLRLKLMIRKMRIRITFSGSRRKENSSTKKNKKQKAKENAFLQPSQQQWDFTDAKPTNWCREWAFIFRFHCSLQHLFRWVLSSPSISKIILLLLVSSFVVVGVVFFFFLLWLLLLWVWRLAM